MIFIFTFLRNAIKILIGNMIIKNTKSLGEFVRQKRRESAVTQKEVALAAGTGLRFIGELENGKHTCHVGKVFDVLRTLGMEVQIGKR